MVNAEARLVHPDEVAVVWSALVPYVKQFLEHGQGESTVASILTNIMNFKFQCWVIELDGELKGVCITKLDHFIGYKALHILGLAGIGWKSWKSVHGSVEDFARFHECDRITIWGRKGWKRLFDKSNFHGDRGETYEHMYDILHMKLNKEE